MFSARVGDAKTKTPSAFHNMLGALFWRRPIDSFAPAHSPFRLPVYLARLPSARFSSAHGRARVGDAIKRKARWHLSQRALSSGDVLLSHGLSPYYHRGCSDSLPCSEWERVGRLGQF